MPKEKNKKIIFYPGQFKVYKNKIVFIGKRGESWDYLKPTYEVHILLDHENFWFVAIAKELKAFLQDKACKLQAKINSI